MLGKELAMTGKIAHVAERKGFELALKIGTKVMLR